MIRRAADAALREDGAGARGDLAMSGLQELRFAKTAAPDANQNGAVPVSANPPANSESVKVASQELASALIAAATENVALSAGLDPVAAAGAVKSIDRDRIADLISQIKESADKLAADQPSRGDLKILSRTMRELRYAFKVFSPYRSRRKVSRRASSDAITGVLRHAESLASGALAARG